MRPLGCRRPSAPFWPNDYWRVWRSTRNGASRRFIPKRERGNKGNYSLRGSVWHEFRHPRFILSLVTGKLKKKGGASLRMIGRAYQHGEHVGIRRGRRPEPFVRHPGLANGLHLEGSPDS